MTAPKHQQKISNILNSLYSETYGYTGATMEEMENGSFSVNLGVQQTDLKRY